MVWQSRKAGLYGIASIWSLFQQTEKSQPSRESFQQLPKTGEWSIWSTNCAEKFTYSISSTHRFWNYSYLKNIWEQHSMITFKDILIWYNNKDVVATLEAMQNMISIYHDKGIFKLKLGCCFQILLISAYTVDKSLILPVLWRS